MPRFSKRSLDALSTCDPRLQMVCHLVIQHFDFTVLEGYRNEEDQNKAFEAGLSQLKYPHSKHNSIPARAVCIAPYPIDWKKKLEFVYLAGYMMMAARLLGVKLRWGGDWNRNMQISDERFLDLGHFELEDD